MSTRIGLRYRNTILAEYLVRQFTESASRLLQRSSSPRSRGVDAPPLTVHDLRARAQKPFVLHAVQRGVQRAGTDAVTVSGELPGDPRSVDLSFRSVVQHVYLHGAAVKGAHVVRLRGGRPE
jgi:glycerate-2-kinase